MKILILFILMLNLYSSDLKSRIEILTNSPEKSTIVYINYDPFQSGKEVVMKTLEAKDQESTLSITTILNNKVFIGSKWYQVGDKAQEYEIMQISKDSVLAKKNGKLIKLGIKKSEKLLKIRDKKQ